MAHYLSEVTHQKLEQRPLYREDESDWATPPSSHTFEGYIRAMEVATHGSDNHANKVTIWTADQEGTISIRDIKGRASYVIEKKPEVHVSAILAHGPYMWVGLSDGYLRIFDQKTYELCFERKQHSGRITCMSAVGADVYTGSDDWLIYRWAAKSFEPVKQMSGHQCSVLCMAYDGGDVLFSGSEDFTIRCWDLELGEERLGQGWPARNHCDGVTALVIYEIHLFSASRDGTIKVWNTQTGGMMKFLDRREGSITCLFKDPASARIWAGGTDGFISVYDAFSLRLITRMRDHTGTYVKHLGICKRLSAMKVWSVNEEGVVKVWYADEDNPYSMYNERAMQLQTVVEEKRWQLTDNYRKIEEHKEEHRRLVDRDDRRKRNMAQEMGFKARKSIESEYYCRALSWVSRQREQAKKRQCAEALTRPSAHAVMRVYYHKLAGHRVERREQRRLESVSQHVCTHTLRNLQSAYYHHLLHYVRAADVSTKRQYASEALCLKSVLRTYGVYYLRWIRWVARGKALARRPEQAAVLHRGSKAVQVNAFYKVLLEFIEMEGINNVKATSIGFLETYANARLMQKYWMLLWRLIRKNRIARLGKLKQRILYSQEQQMQARKHFYCLWQFVHQRHNDRLREAFAAQREQTDELERVIAMQGAYTDEEIDAELAQLNEELATTLREIDEVNKDTEGVLDAQKAMRWEISKARINMPDGTREQQLRHVMQLLKARSVHCQRDFDQLTETREDGKKIGPGKLYDEGVRKVRSAVSQETVKRAKKTGQEVPKKTMSEDGVWLLVDSVDTFTKKGIRQGALGIRDMVIAYDMMTINPAALSKVGHTDEVLLNAGTMLDIVERASRLSDKDLRERGSRKSSSKKKKSSGKKKSGKKKSTKKKSLTDGAESPRKVSKKSSTKRTSALASPKKKTSSKKKRSLSDPSTTPRKVSKKKSSSKKKVSSKKKSSSKKKVSKKKSSSKKKVSKKKSSSKKKVSKKKISKKKKVTTKKKSGTKKTTSKKKVSKKKVSKKKSTTGTKKSTTKTHPATSALTSMSPRAAAPKPWLGMRINMEDTQRVMVAHVERKSPANAAGIGDYDIITSFGGNPVTDVPSFQAAFKEHCRVGAKIPVELLRNGDEDEAYDTVLLVGSSADRPDKPSWVSGDDGKPPASTPRGVSTPRDVATPRRDPEDPKNKPWMGMRIRTDDPQERAIITEVARGGPAEVAGLGDDDVLTSFDGTPIKKVSDFSSVYRKVAKVNKSIPVKVFHNGNSSDERSYIIKLASQADKQVLSGQWVDGAEDAAATAPRSTPDTADLARAIAETVSPQTAPAVDPNDPKHKPWMGMRIRTDVPDKALVTDVAKGGPADVAGLGDDDVLTSFGGSKVKAFNDFVSAYQRNAKVGKAIPVKAFHNGDVTDERNYVIMMGSQYDREQMELNWVDGAEDAEAVVIEEEKPKSPEAPPAAESREIVIEEEVVEATVEEEKVEEPVEEVDPNDPKHKPWMGMRIRTDVPDKALVTDVAKSGPADKAGLGDDDVLTSFNGEDVSSFATFVAAYKQSAKVGKAIPVTALHNGDKDDERNYVILMGSQYDREQMELNWVEGAEDAEAKAEEEFDPEDPRNKPWMGMRIGRDDDSIVVCADVDASGPAARAGLGDNDVIKSFGGEPISDFESFREAYAKHGKVGADIAISVYHDGDEAQPYDTILTMGCVADRTGVFVAGTENPQA